MARDQAGLGDDRPRREERDPHRRGARPVEVSALHAGLPGDRPVGGRQRRPRARVARQGGPRAGTRWSSTRATRDSFSATTASSTSASCTKSRSGCRFSSAGRRGIKPGTRSDAMALNIDFAPTFLEVAGLPASADMQGRSLLPVLARPHAVRLAHVDVLPLLPRPRRPQHEGALRRAHAHAQADLLLEEGPVGAVRPGQRSVRAPQPVRRARAGRADGQP